MASCPARKSRQVRGHLEACWQCRTAVEELEAHGRRLRALSQERSWKPTCRRRRRRGPISPKDLPGSTPRWELSRGWRGSGIGSPRRPRAAGLFPRPPRCCLAAGSVYQFRETPSVQAATLLQRAVTVAATHPRPARPVRMRTNIKNRAVVPAMLRSAHYNSEAPLSAKSFQEWRDGLTSKRDEVTTVADPESPAQNCYRIETAAADGELAIASMMLRATDLHPVEGRFEFRNRDWVEYDEISDASTTDGGTPADTRLDAPMRRTVPPSRSAALPSGNPASISEELRVLVALHEIGADLGDPVEVNHTGGRILVSGVGVPAAAPARHSPRARFHAERDGAVRGSLGRDARPPAGCSAV